MRHFTIGILSTAALIVVASCGKSPEGKETEAVNAGGQSTPADPAKYYTVNALPVPDARIGALQGKFKMVEATAADGIHTDGTGGACLVFAPADLGYPAMAANKSCTTNQSCETGEIGTDGTKASATYCDGKTHMCWAKPGSNGAALALCNKGIKMAENELNYTPADKPAGSGPIDASHWVKEGAQVRVVACLQRIDAIKGTQGNGCPTVDGKARIEVMGPVANVKK